MGVESSIEHPTPILTFPLPGGRDRICAYACLQLSAHNLCLQRIAAIVYNSPTSSLLFRNRHELVRCLTCIRPFSG